MIYNSFLNQILDDVRCLVGVYHLYALRCCSSALKISVSHTFVKIGLLPFEAVQGALLRRDASASDGGRQVEEQRQVRLQMPMYPLLELQELGLVEAASAALVSIGGVAEAVTDHPVATRQGRLDHLLEMLPAGGKHQQGLGLQVHGLVQQQFAELLAKPRTAGLAGAHHRFAVVANKRRGSGNMAALAGAVDAFKGDESAGLHACTVTQGFAPL